MSTGTQTPTKEAAAAPRASTKQRLSTVQMLHLMRLEADKALRHGYPISAVVLGLDGFDEEHHLPWRQALMPAFFQELKNVTFKNDVRGLGIWTERFILAVFPYVTPDALTPLVEDLQHRCLHVTVDGVPEDESITTSTGVSHNQYKGEHSFESLIEDAETGMGIAQSGGGNRIVQAREVERELDRLRDEVEIQINEIKEFQKKLFGDGGSEQELWGKQLVDKVVELFRREPTQTEALLRVEKEVIAVLRAELAAWRETSVASQMIDSQKTIDNLERRVAKLTESLGLTEAELKRVAAMKNIDLGVASIYRTVQGLSGDDDNAEQKKEMLKNIFDANIALRAELETLN